MFSLSGLTWTLTFAASLLMPRVASRSGPVEGAGRLAQVRQDVAVSVTTVVDWFGSKLFSRDPAIKESAGGAVQNMGRLEAQAKVAIEQILSNGQKSLLAPVPPMPVGSQYYAGMVRRVLTSTGLPSRLLGVAQVESGYNPAALSPVGARGLWQFMPDTARQYGLRVDSQVDERTDPEKSTVAAAHYLKDLHSQFRDWNLALASYNAGQGRVQRVIRRTGIRSFTRMVRKKLLPQETRNYVPRVLSARVVVPVNFEQAGQ